MVRLKRGALVRHLSLAPHWARVRTCGRGADFGLRGLAARRVSAPFAEEAVADARGEGPGSISTSWSRRDPPSRTPTWTASDGPVQIGSEPWTPGRPSPLATSGRSVRAGAVRQAPQPPAAVWLRTRRPGAGPRQVKATIEYDDVVKVAVRRPAARRSAAAPGRCSGTSRERAPLPESAASWSRGARESGAGVGVSALTGAANSPATRPPRAAITKVLLRMGQHHASHQQQNSDPRARRTGAGTHDLS